MMNLIAVTLVATSLAVAGVFSPNPQTNNNNGEDQVIVKDGHRAVVVEYADTAADGNTKVSISPPHSTNAAVVEDQLSRAAASVAGVAQDAKGKAQETLSAHLGPHGAGPRELICDAYGKCKHKIASAWSRAKEKAAKAEEEVKEVVGGAVDKAKDLASTTTHKVEERTEGVRQNAQEKFRETGEAAERMKQKMGEKAMETGEMARETAEKVKGKTEDVVEEIKQKGGEKKKELSDIAKRGKEVVFDAIGYVVGLELVGSLMGMIQILGFAMAYGISVWVTFIMSHVLAGVLPRQQFGMVQSKIYSVYFKAMVGSLGLALLGHLLGNRVKVFKNKAEMFQAYNLMGSMLSVLANLLFLEPKATKAMFQRMKMEKEEGRGQDRDRTSGAARAVDTVVTDAAGPVPTTSTTTREAESLAPPRADQDEVKAKMAKLDDRLKKLNSYSSLLNILTLMGLTWHLVYLSQRLEANRC